MEKDFVKELTAVYLMLNDEMREGNFLQKRFHRVTILSDGKKASAGVVYGAHLDIVASLIEQDAFLAEDSINIGSFMYKGGLYSSNGSVELVEPGKVDDVRGEVVLSGNSARFRPMTFAQNSYLNDLRTKERFIRYASGIADAAQGIAVEDGFLRVYGEHQAPSARDGMLLSVPVTELADRLYDVKPVEIAKPVEVKADE